MVRQILFQTTGAHTATPVSPDLVAAGTIACFNAATGAVSAMDGAAPTKCFLVQGHATFPILSPVFTLGDALSVEKQLYVLPVKQRINYTSVPVGPTGGAEYILKVTEVTNPVERRGGTEPRYRRNYSETVIESQVDENTIYAFVDQINVDTQRIVNAGANKIITGDFATTSGTVGITITDPLSGRSATYTEAYAVGLSNTAVAFIASHAATILSTFGIVATNPSGATITFTGGVPTNKGGADYTAVDDGTGGCTWTPSTTEATTLFVEALAQGTQFKTIMTQDGVASAAVLATTNAHVEGSGSPQQVLQMEQEAQGAFANYYRETPQPLTPDTYTSTNNFDLYTVRFKTTQDGQTPVNKHQYQELVLAIVDGLSGDLDTFFGI